jgi:serine/threonine protein kinase
MTKLPASPATVLKLFMHRMSNFEQAEILGYAEIYYLGLVVERKEQVKSQVFDDDRGDYKIIIGDHVSYRYEILQVLGRGSFGQVVKAFDHKSKQELALKIIRNKSRFHEQALIEVKILKYLKERDPNDHHCIVHLSDYFSFRKHMCITFELLSMNLYEFLKLNSFQGLSPSLIKRFASQMLEALVLLNKHKVIHCDLKPENILLKSEKHSSLKVIDFGSSCFYEQRIYTYIQSRFYRAPEIILGISYNTSIDMWSFGCILVELFTGYPVFPGESEAEQIQCMMEVLGLPPSSLLDRATRKKLFFDGDHPKITPNSRGKVRFPGKKPLKDLLRKADSLFLQLVMACLEWDPSRRLTPEEAKEHEWFSDSPKLNKSSSRGGSAQPHQGLTPRHIKKTSEVLVKATVHRSHKRSVNFLNKN